MTIYLNENPLEAGEGITLYQLRDRYKPAADVLIVNGFALSSDRPLAEGDRVVLIRRGEQPSPEELETLLYARHTPGVQAKLKQGTVGIAGAGGLGSAVAVALARSGVGCLILADFDVVEPSNLNRQQFFVDQIGMPKVEALRDNLRRINPGVDIRVFNGRLTPANIGELFAGVDVLVEAFDAPDQKAMLVQTFLQATPRSPIVAASGVAGAGPSNTIITRRAASRLYLVGDGDSEARPGQGLMAPRVGIAAHHQANAVLRLLLGKAPEQ
ncbi:sulfur carrier protein ThiS adenylyltransferase ThiF [Desulfuromonas sp. AOP6]|uniref:sulfur carrier protein ThiS adenylyltransferase ThiF n=1 Tax=Desulfuromonas sp. AOP6 TaxID=1566351 RepID=UPI00127AC890|nr:sulfur carrier protein ThiS adenylyltransferase ThiF [Desulfuromonas sp. AOP6]BCA78949.1 thiamine biosynthesis protein ThiF [Desulfuromonas sp. AOP6]